MARKPSRKPTDQTAPVTLAQAVALARAKLRTPRGRTVAQAPARPVALGLERTKLARSRAQEKRCLIREYKLTLETLKKRGVKGLAQKAKKSARRARGPAGPLQILAEGDSWFKYPVLFFGGGIIPRLAKRVGVPILNLAKAGDETRYMLGVEERTEIIEQLTNGCPAGGPWDVMLFSGGGNDIVDNPMALWIRDYDAALPPARQIHQPRFDAALALVRAAYEDLIGLRDQLSPGTHLVFHGYDFAIPDGRGVCNLGPWLKPTFDLRRFPNQRVASAVVRAMLEQFAAMLQSLHSPRKKITFINAQDTLAPKKSSWHNELHPSKKGFNAFADIFHREIEALFPDRVL